jgi:hypothetical protein
MAIIGGRRSWTNRALEQESLRLEVMASLASERAPLNEILILWYGPTAIYKEPRMVEEMIHSNTTSQSIKNLPALTPQSPIHRKNLHHHVLQLQSRSCFRGFHGHGFCPAAR